MSRIKIVGAGPSGLSCAIGLAKAGYEVEVHERNADAGMRWENSFQAFENASEEKDFLFALREMGIGVNFFCVPQREIEVFGDGKKGTRFSSKEPFLYLIRRGTAPDTLDQGLKRQALEAGVELRLNSRLEPKAADVVATGGRTPEGVALEMVFETDIDDTFTVLLDNSIAPAGYAYLIAHNGYATISTAVVKDLANIERYFEKAVERLQGIKGFKIRNPRKKGNIVSFYLPRTAVRNGKLHIGEAAGFQDFLFGFGLRYAIASGWLAARSIMENGDYDELWRKAFRDRLEAGIFNRFAYELGGNMGYGLFMRSARGRDFRDYLGGWFKSSTAKRLLLPLIKLVWKNRGRCAHESCEWCAPRRS